METMEFVCPKEGMAGGGIPLYLIRVPVDCCGVKTTLGSVNRGHRKDGAADFFNSCCSTHLSDYKEIWKTWVTTFSVDLTKDVVCCICQLHNVHAVPNLPDGKYICKVCRT